MLNIKFKMMNVKGIVSRKRGRSISLLHSSFIILHLSFTTLLPCAKAQPGTWHSHPSFLSAQTLAAVQNKIYCASENGFFYFDPVANEATRLSRDDGFSETGISQLFYVTDQKRLLVGYHSGTIDLLSVSDAGEPGTLTTITLIRDATQIPGSKRINHVSRTGNDAYLAWDGISHEQASTEAWLDEWVFGVADRADYLAKLGAETVARLRPRPALAAPVDYGAYA